MAKPRNLLFLFSDQHTPAVTGCYGDKVVDTPHIDRLAAEGVRFTNAYCPSPVCVPSRMSMLTGRFPHRQECWTNDDILRSDLPTWLHAMGAAGARPVLIGRMHALGPDQLHGYAERHVGDHSPNWPGTSRHSLGVLAGTNDPQPEAVAKSGPGHGAYQAKDEDVTEAAVKWLREEAPRHAASGTPFALTVGLMLPHPPYVVDRAAFEAYADRVPPPNLGPEAADHPFHTWWRGNRGIDDVPADAVARARAAYWGLVARMDEMIGRVLAALGEAGLMDDTLIVYASDHGDHVGERDLWWKHTFYEESVKVPLVMRLPGVLPAGAVRDQVVNLTDLSQTMIEAMGGAPLPHADGRSFWALAQDAAAPWQSETFSEYCTDAVPAWTGGRAVQQRMIRSGDHKLIIYDNAPDQLFDLAADPLETRNLAADPAHQTVRNALRARLTEGWNAGEIAARMAERRIEKDRLGAWARAIQPESTQVWSFDPAINRLDDPDGSG
ncbi:sulfatase-like hydrolase/transferase [Acuticoccus sp. MNP-M23]|uniref:sulfatase-like hydrolase/transferase n=1 Tax=Acuticoccus sp. MNP-M23 TaxID=3072793 RepID=UPI002814B583|nr:sulfatase-like hydrolase/transferase [Acuticoccus sp. MNP-M23]WMS42978.1 sulfatase-like hydrolase/transferase [Acuticoccus sp. MNP-M23]